MRCTVALQAWLDQIRTKIWTRVRWSSKFTAHPHTNLRSDVLFLANGGRGFVLLTPSPVRRKKERLIAGNSNTESSNLNLIRSSWQPTQVFARLSGRWSQRSRTLSSFDRALLIVDESKKGNSCAALVSWNLVLWRRDLSLRYLRVSKCIVWKIDTGEHLSRASSLSLSLFPDAHVSRFIQCIAGAPSFRMWWSKHLDWK